ncbi:hypothetical protein AK812_SmicGene43953 [Symbiodinium microadriaticum]|uniref:Uncharacterized protein n=1 Tax=Symbiodinium microadriaticum TaxID=2951 RepID=A0A1Q9BZP2_SYMMI|nr:hypothetical protein AK812_SmicGene43953 [Symbiodinium microadriaticum]CAE7928196.1 unnamed protein product [Symbiodinium sp. KB8]
MQRRGRVAAVPARAGLGPRSFTASDGADVAAAAPPTYSGDTSVAVTRDAGSWLDGLDLPAEFRNPVPTLQTVPRFLITGEMLTAAALAPGSVATLEALTDPARRPAHPLRDWLDVAGPHTRLDVTLEPLRGLARPHTRLGMPLWSLLEDSQDSTRLEALGMPPWFGYHLIDSAVQTFRGGLSGATVELYGGARVTHLCCERRRLRTWTPRDA